MTDTQRTDIGEMCRRIVELAKKSTRTPWEVDDEVIGDGGYEPSRIIGTSRRSGDPYCVCEMRPGSNEESDAEFIVTLANHAPAIATACLEMQTASERAFQVLESLGIPRERAKNVANGIQVYDQRIQREVQQLEADNRLYREVLESSHTCATIRNDGTCDGCAVSEALSPAGRKEKQA